MDVHDAAFKRAQKIALQHPHKTREHNQIHFRPLQRADKRPFRLLVQLGAEFPRRNELRRNFPVARVRQNPRAFDVAQDDGDLRRNFPAATASAIATKFEPLPEPRTPNRNLSVHAI